ncbi:MAG: M48 family metallopeptidase [Patescibacteria group bacterium]|jgi:heat shock protein HtpX
MATTYDYIAANKRRSFFLIVGFTLFIAAIGWIFAEPLGFGYGLLTMAVLFALVMNLVGYFKGDKIALRVSGAQGPLQKGQNDYVYRMVENLCITSGMPMPKIYIIPDQAMNAFATGRSPKNASIALTTGIIENLENEELEGVIAHELSHIKNFDIRFMTLVVVLVGVITLLSQFFFRISFFGGGRKNGNGNGQLGAIFGIVGVVLIIFAPIIAEIIKLAISRKREYLADASGALLTRFPEGLASALEKLKNQQNGKLLHANGATAHLFLSNPFGPNASGTKKLFSTHPPIEDRIRLLREMGNMHESH